MKAKVVVAGKDRSSFINHQVSLTIKIYFITTLYIEDLNTELLYL